MSSTLRSRGGLLFAFVLLCGLVTTVATQAPSAEAEDAPAARTSAGPQLFDTPEALAKAVIDAAAANDDAALKKLVGPKQAAFIQEGTDPAVQKERLEFANRAKEKSALQKNDDGSMTIVVGEDAWPLPLPLVQKGEKWFIDAEAGRTEMTARRIGRNELRAIAICRLYDDAQVEYASKDRDGDQVLEYAQRIRSTPGKQDGLFWEAGEGLDVSPLGPLVADWREQLGSRAPTGEKKVPVGGYYWRLLTGQGSAAPGGRHSYIINGNQIAGFALVGYPARYMETGVMTFMISHHGTVYEQDLGANTACLVQNMRGFNPTKGWTAVKD